jgi:hypothetical protein
MLKSKKKKPDPSKSQNRALVFGIADAAVLLVLYLFYFYFDLDRFLAVGIWGFLTFSMALFLWFYDKEACDEFMDVYP